MKVVLIIACLVMAVFAQDDKPLEFTNDPFGFKGFPVDVGVDDDQDTLDDEFAPVEPNISLKDYQRSKGVVFNLEDYEQPQQKKSLFPYPISSSSYNIVSISLVCLCLFSSVLLMLI